MYKRQQAEDKNGNKIIKQEKRVFKRFTDGRRQMQKSKEQEYEIQWQGEAGFTSWVPRAKLLQTPGFPKLLKHCDERIAAKATQLVRPLTQKFVEGHLDDVGLEAEFATHTRMGALSGGQKVKVVLAASMWNTPHIVILDEPTNYLDRDSLGALASAIKAYQGGVIIISHQVRSPPRTCSRLADRAICCVCRARRACAYHAPTTLPLALIMSGGTRPHPHPHPPSLCSRSAK